MANRIDSSGVSLVHEDRVSIKKCGDDDYDGLEIVYNNKIRSAYMGGNKKKLHPLLIGPCRRDQGKCTSLHTASKNNLSEFTQRVMSAKLLRVKQVQNQLSETQIQLNELINENRILKNLQKRQEGALRKYEGNHAELPQLIRSHNEEIRTLKANNKLMKTQLKETNGKLKEKDNELESLKESYSKLKRLCSEKNLLEREKLQKKVDDLQQVIKEQEDKIQVLSRKLLLESKNYRHHLNIEMNKHKETQKDLSNALSMITKLENQLLMKDKVNWIPGSMGKLSHKRDTKVLMPTVPSKSLVLHSNVANAEDAPTEEIPVTNMDESPENVSDSLNGPPSEGNQSPIQEIFSAVISNKKEGGGVTTSTLEIRKSKNVDGGGQDGKKQPEKLRPKNSFVTHNLSAGEAELNARGIADKLNRKIEDLDFLVQQNEMDVASSTVRLNSLYDELKSNVSIIGDETKIKVTGVKEVTCETDIGASGEGFRRSVPKRKLPEEKGSGRETHEQNEISQIHHQKLLTMTKTWNSIKDKVQEERMRAEEKMKEFEMMEREESDDDEKPTDDGKPDNFTMVDTLIPLVTDNCGAFSSGFANESSILEELQKTDKDFKRLKNEKTRENKPGKQQSQAGKPQEKISYRTESHAAPKYVEEFQTEYQKRNLLRALKAIDVGKSGDSSDESEGSPATERVTPFVRAENGGRDFISELFGSNSKKMEKIDMEYGVVEAVNAGKN